MQRADAEVQAAVGVQGGLGIMAGSVESEMQIHQHTWRATCMSTHTDTHAYIQTRTNTHMGTPIHPHTHTPTIKHHTSIHSHMLKTLRTDLVDVFDKDRVLIGREHLHGVPVG